MCRLDVVFTPLSHPSSSTTSASNVHVLPNLNSTLIHLTSPRGDFRATLSSYGACLLSYQSLSPTSSLSPFLARAPRMPSRQHPNPLNH